MNKNLSKILSSKGLITYQLSNSKLFELIKIKIFESLEKTHKISLDNLDELHKFINPNELNNLRLNLAATLNEDSFASDLIFSNLKNPLQSILGPDIAIQKNVGLSIQLPDDSSSLLHVHSDVYDSDCSPYEIVIWIPLVNCFKTKSMFFLPFTETKSIGDYLKLHKRLRENLSKPELISNKFEFIKLSPPSIVFFSHSIWHGNTVNKTDETRFSLNVRVKNVFTPYRGKKLGDFFKIAEISDFTKLASEIEIIINE
ncbi:MAG: hypothetical protein CMG00_00245 [Candidatus Marinimicrobia bacterium]|nr:hypothetical protein [Candidatus Neomarinimicrobiota bacterium]